MFKSHYFLLTCINGVAFAFILGDVNNDGKIDHAESINAMQVMAGIKSQISIDNVWQQDGNKVFIKDVNVGINTDNPRSALEINGVLRTRSIHNMANSFFVDGDKDKYYAVIFNDQSWWDGPAEFEITRSNVHADGEWHGSMNLKIFWHSSRFGHQSGFLEYQYQQNRGHFVSYIKNYEYKEYLFIWLKGQTTYNYRSINNNVTLKTILGTDNQPCIFNESDNPNYDTKVDCTYRTEVHESIQYGKMISLPVRIDSNVEVNGQFTLNGNITSEQDICIGKCDN
ncbi:MAG: hypothetical protein OMM_02789 [Candidatus Magnetoglobus multicellularis str. Araruama]|uniref:EF-hand domain-containing protein n=1 Tax=Candidatus Magnetoglobus multicellularis str. Araruama TaxID=890399 RepID=A0A1V1P828_9BACT|nr:MAG: hypothetical protein OMM_02789 [Candidatus Magnetoglobus multicellularis str. Araruama]